MTACTWVFKEVPKLNDPGKLFKVVGVPDFDEIFVCVVVKCPVFIWLTNIWLLISIFITFGTEWAWLLLFRAICELPPT